jgi:hypothetical protein
MELGDLELVKRIDLNQEMPSSLWTCRMTSCRVVRSLFQKVIRSCRE